MNDIRQRGRRRETVVAVPIERQGRGVRGRRPVWRVRERARPRAGRIAGVFVAAAALSSIGPARWIGPELGAQQPPPDPVPTILTLTDALERAAEHNPEYRMALNLMELEGSRERAAWGAFLPEVSLNFGTGYTLRREESWVDFEGNPVANPNVRTVASSYTNQAAAASLVLFGGGGRLHALEEARSLGRARRFGATRNLNGILADVWRQFLLVQRWKARAAVEATLLSAREGDFARSRRLFDLSMIDRSDLLGARLDLEDQRLAVIESRGMVEMSLLALRKAIGDPSLSAPDLDHEIVEAFDPGCLDVEFLVERTLRESPVVAEAEALLSGSRASLRARKASRWPRLTLFTSANRNAYGSDRTALFEVNPGGFSGSLGVSVAVPVFDRFQTTRNIADASVGIRNAGETMRQAALELEERIRFRHVELTTAWAMLGQRSARREVAAERLRMVREAYELQARTIEDLRAAIRDEAVALRDEVDQRHDFALALVGLYDAAGIVAREAGLGGAGPVDALWAPCGGL